MGLISPGRNVRCIRSVECTCGNHRASEGSIYMCEEVGFGGLFHAITCRTPNCDNVLIAVRGKAHGFCACCFAPLDDGDTSMVQDQDTNPYDVKAPAAPQEEDA